MAEELENSPESSEEEAPQTAAGVGAGKSLIIAFVGIVVLLETGMFFFLVPSAEQVSALAEAKLIESVQRGEVAAEAQESDDNQPEEIDLGQFGEVFSPIDTERFYRVEIDLYGLVRKKNLELMKEELADKDGRLRQAIRMKIRTSSLEELSDNNLGLLERRILTESNHLLTDDLLLGIGFKRFDLLEQ